LDSCEDKPLIVVDSGPWYRWALERLGITYFQETFGKRNRIERWFREMKERTKMFYNNINAKTLKSLEEPRRAGNCNCSNAQHHQARRRRGNTT
jgi:transposase-like protein